MEKLLKMKYKDFYIELLMEAVEDLFHLTGVDKFLNMMKENRILLSFAGTSPSDSNVNFNKHFYLSTSREKYGGYGRGRSNFKGVSYPVNIVLNGRNIENTRDMVLKSVDYWGKNLGSIEHNETEERVISDRHELKPLNRYIKEVHIHIRDELRGVVKHEINEILTESDKYSFPIFFYVGDSQKIIQSYKSQAKKYSVTKEEMKSLLNSKFKDVPLEEPYKRTGRYYGKDDVLNLINMSKNPENYINYEKLSKEENRLIDRISGLDRDSTLTGIDKDKIRDELFLLTKEIKRVGEPNLTTFIRNLGEKIITLRGIKNDLETFNGKYEWSTISNLVENISHRVDIKKYDGTKLMKLSDKLKNMIKEDGRISPSIDNIMYIYNLKNEL